MQKIRLFSAIALSSFLAHLCFANSQIKYSPYKDFTINTYWDNSTNQMEPEDLTTISQSAGVKQFTLAFVVADSFNPHTCSPTWGGTSEYSVANQWGLTDIENFEQTGGNVTISFGGQAGTDLSQDCSDVTTLTSAYQSVINAYHVNQLDFDIEGALIADTSATNMMMAALNQIQKNNSNVTVSFTLPVLPTGLTQQGINVIQQAINNNVNIQDINLMTMDYGSYAAPDPSQMAQYTIDASQATAKQLQNLYPNKSIVDINHMISLTPMIGINDVNPERFTVADIQTIVQYAQSSGLYGLGSWSIDRDHPCTSQWASPTCSGALTLNGQLVQMQTTDYQFASAFTDASAIKIK